MSDNKLSTDSYKGVRDFYPEDMAIQRYIFSTWSKTAETFGFERYDASILEPAELYRAKGSVNEEMANEQTYTFVDRGEREVTLRPEMTPTVARMVAGRRRELNFPVRWYSIPNLFRYERPQRGRLREHWQLNCDLFGADHFTAEVEMIALAQQLLLDFGATPEMFEIKINHRSFLRALLASYQVTDVLAATRLIDRLDKLPAEEFKSQLALYVAPESIDPLFEQLTSADENLINRVDANSSLMATINGLRALGINNVSFSPSLARGFDYYTGTIFEIFDRHPDGTRRAMLGGGRYDNLTGMFSDEPISGIGFGMGDVTMRDFLETHHLLEDRIKPYAPTLAIVPTSDEYNLEAEKIAQLFRQREVRTTVDFGTKKLGKKIADAALHGVSYLLVVGPDELSSGTFTVKNLKLTTEESGTLETLLTYLIAHS